MTIDTTSPLTSHDDGATAGELGVEVTVRGATRRLRWNERGVSGDRDAVSRLLRISGEPDSAVAFLQAVRTAFGTDIHTSVVGTVTAPEV